MTGCCPTCGAALRDDAVFWDQNAGVLVAGGKAVRFSPRESLIFDALWRSRHRGGFQTREQFIEAAYADDIDGGPESSSTISVHLWKIRRKLEGCGYTIPQNMGMPRTGYRIAKDAA